MRRVGVPGRAALTPVPRSHPNLVYLLSINTPVTDLTPVLSLSQLSLLDIQGTTVDCASPVTRQLAGSVEFFQSNCQGL